MSGDQSFGNREPVANLCEFPRKKSFTLQNRRDRNRQGYSLPGTQPVLSGSQTANRIGVTILLAITGLILSVQSGRCDDLVEQGGQIAANLCSECHAIAGPGPSPVQEAPVFSTLGRQVEIDDLAEALAEGILTGHGPVEMPEFTLEPDQIDALLAYLHSIQK